MRNEATLVTTWADAQFISVIETFPHSSDCACAATGAAIAPAASIVDSFFIAIPFQFMRRAGHPMRREKSLHIGFYTEARSRPGRFAGVNHFAAIQPPDATFTGLDPLV
jgi:hypothetical protein